MPRTIVNGMETFKDNDGTIYHRPAEIKEGMEVGIIGDQKSIAISGTVTRLKVTDGQILVFVDVGGSVPIPRRLNSLAIPLN